MGKWEEEVSVTLTKSEWLEVLLALWDRHSVIESQTDISEETKRHWQDEIEVIQKSIRLVTSDTVRNAI
jgi:hypothetical protein